jgi:hypothetical protein
MELGEDTTRNPAGDDGDYVDAAVTGAIPADDGHDHVHATW